MDSLAEMAEDVESTRGFIIGAGFIALLFGFFWMVVMKMCAGPITWAAIILFILSCFGISYYTYTVGIKKQEEIDSIVLAPGEKPERNYPMYAAYVFTAISVIFFITICCLYKKI